MCLEPSNQPLPAPSPKPNTMSDSDRDKKRPAPRRMDTRTVTFANAFEYAASRLKLATPWVAARAAEAEEEGAAAATKKRRTKAGPYSLDSARSIWSPTLHRTGKCMRKRIE